MRWIAIIAFLLLFSHSPSCAEEFFGLGGDVRNLDTDTNDTSYSWQLEYQKELFEHLAVSLSYLNEGHVPNHHRDGTGMQLWARTDALGRRLSLSAGIGPYYYYDTSNSSVTDGSYTNDHGFGGIFSLAATWKNETPWLFQVRTNWVKAFGGMDTVSALVGIGYQLDTLTPVPAHATPGDPGMRANNEITLFVGQTITNSFKSEHSAAMSIEYRRGLMRYLDWTIAWLYEGDTRLIRRHGLVSQFWLVKAFLDDSVALGAGTGAYFSVDQRAGQDGDEIISAIASLTGSYRFTPHWSLRTTWNRAVTNYDRDTDVIMAGIGYRF